MTSRFSNSTNSLSAVRAGMALVLCSLLLTGCSSGPYESAPVNPDKARETLTTALESWKNGVTTEDLRQQTPSIVVQDFDWMGGVKLLDYEVLDEGNPESANLVSQVKLSLEDKDGAKSEKTVTYLVGTAPVLTVFRDMFK